MRSSRRSANSRPMTDATWIACRASSARRSSRAARTSWMLSGTAMAPASCASTTRPLSRLSVPSSSSDRVTSSTKNGLPSALAAIRALTSEGMSRVPSSAPLMSLISPAVSGWSVTRTWKLRSPKRWAWPGRYEQIRTARVVGTTSARKTRHSSDAESIQWRSSTTSTSGVSRATRSTSALSARKISLRRVAESSAARVASSAARPRTCRTKGSVHATSSPSCAIARSTFARAPDSSSWSSSPHARRSASMTGRKAVVAP